MKIAAISACFAKFSVKTVKKFMITMNNTSVVRNLMLEILIKDSFLAYLRRNVNQPNCMT